MTHEERVYHHLYETLEGIAEQSERIANLEEPVLDMWPLTVPMPTAGCDERRVAIHERMSELGLEVPS